MNQSRHVKSFIRIRVISGEQPSVGEIREEKRRVRFAIRSGNKRRRVACREADAQLCLPSEMRTLLAFPGGSGDGRDGGRIALNQRTCHWRHHTNAGAALGSALTIWGLGAEGCWDNLWAPSCIKSGLRGPKTPLQTCGSMGQTTATAITRLHRDSHLLGLSKRLSAHGKCGELGVF